MTSTLATGQEQSAAGRAEWAAGGGLPDRFRIDISDLGEACDLITRVYGPVRISTQDKTTRVHLTGLGAGPLRLGQTDLRMTVDYQAAPVSRVRRLTGPDGWHGWLITWSATVTVLVPR